MDEFEINEAAYRFENLGEGVAVWQEYILMKRRGDRRSLTIFLRDQERSRSAVSKERGSAVPPPMNRREVQKIGEKRAGDGHIMHVDATMVVKSCKYVCWGVFVRCMHTCLYSKAVLNALTNFRAACTHATTSYGADAGMLRDVGVPMTCLSVACMSSVANA